MVSNGVCFSVSEVFVMLRLDDEEIGLERNFSGVFGLWVGNCLDEQADWNARGPE